MNTNLTPELKAKFEAIIVDVKGNRVVPDYVPDLMLQAYELDKAELPPFDAEQVATDYALQYPERDYHDLQHAVIYGIVAYSNHINQPLLNPPTK